MASNQKLDSLERLNKLKVEGALTEEEFNAEKDKVLKGSSNQSHTPKPIERKTNGAAVAGFILALVGGFVWALALPFGVLGLILSIVGSSKDKKVYKNHGLATVGIILSILLIIIGLVVALGSLGIGGIFGVGKNSLDLH